MMRAATHAAGPIGLSISGRFWSAAQLAIPRRGGVPELLAAAHVPRSSHGGAELGEGEAREIFGSLARLGFVGGRLVISADPRSVVTSILDLPPRSSGAPLDQIARMEMMRAHRLEEGAFECATWDLPASSARRGQEQTPVLAVACRHEHADGRLRAFDGVPLFAEGLDLTGLALGRACARMLLPADGPASLAAMVHVGWDALDIAIMHTTAEGGRVLVYERSIAESGLSVLGERMKKRGVGSEEAFDAVLAALSGREEQSARIPAELRSLAAEFAEGAIPEVNQSLSFASRRFADAPGGQALVTGEGAMLRGLAERMHQATGVDVTVVRVGDVVRVPEALAGLAGSTALLAAVGLATPRGGGGAAREEAA